MTTASNANGSLLRRRRWQPPLFMEERMDRIGAFPFGYGSQGPGHQLSRQPLDLSNRLLIRPEGKGRDGDG